MHGRWPTTTGAYTPPCRCLYPFSGSQPIAYYHSRYRDAKDELLHLALLFEAERETGDQSQQAQAGAQQPAASMALTKQEEAAAPLPPSDLILRKGRGGVGGGGSKGGSVASRGRAGGK